MAKHGNAQSGGVSVSERPAESREQAVEELAREIYVASIVKNGTRTMTAKGHFDEAILAASVFFDELDARKRDSN